MEVRLDTETTANELGGLTNGQIVALIDNLLANRGPQGASHDELLQLVEMASDARDNWRAPSKAASCSTSSMASCELACQCGVEDIFHRNDRFPSFCQPK